MASGHFWIPCESYIRHQNVGPPESTRSMRPTLGRIVVVSGLLTGLIAVLARLNGVVAAVARIVCLTLIGVMTLIVISHVIQRLTFEAPSWTEEVSLYMMIWIAFLVLPVAYRAGSNVSIEFLKALLPQKARLLLELVFNVLIFAIVTQLFLLSLDFSEAGFRRTARTFDLPLGYIYSVTTYGYVTLMLVVVEMSLRQIRALLDADFRDDPVIAHAGGHEEAPMTGVSVPLPDPDEIARDPFGHDETGRVTPRDRKTDGGEPPSNGTR